MNFYAVFHATMQPDDNDDDDDDDDDQESGW